VAKKVAEKILYLVIKDFKLNNGKKFEVKQAVAETDCSEEEWTVLLEMKAVAPVAEVKADGENS
jgi:hypothetical protein